MEGYVTIIAGLAVSLFFTCVIALKCRVPWSRTIPQGIFLGALCGTLLWMTDRWLVSMNLFWTVIAALCVGALLWILWIFYRFFRDPERIPPPENGIIVSPADGVIRYVYRVESGEIPVSRKGRRAFALSELTGAGLEQDASFLIGVEMSILDVHVNRSPVGGLVRSQKRIPGRFISLRLEEAPLTNERVTTVIDTGGFQVGVVQIASRLVRRIVSFRKNGDHVNQGDRIGKIVFGSQVDVVVPDIYGLSICVEPGQTVKAGRTILAKFLSDKGENE
jgi:phosphatidylserine decarboxylase